MVPGNFPDVAIEQPSRGAALAAGFCAALRAIDAILEVVDVALECYVEKRDIGSLNVAALGGQGAPELGSAGTSQGNNT